MLLIILRENPYEIMALGALQQAASDDAPCVCYVLSEDTSTGKFARVQPHVCMDYTPCTRRKSDDLIHDLYLCNGLCLHAWERKMQL